MTIHNPLHKLIDEKDINGFRYFMYELYQSGKTYFLRNDLLHLFDSLIKDCKDNYTFDKNSSLYKFIHKTQEVILRENKGLFLYRREIARYKVYVIYENSDHFEEETVSDYLDFKDTLVDTSTTDPAQKVTIDFLPFYDYAPEINDSKKVGNGIEFLNNYMSSQFIHNPDKFKNILFEFLKIHSVSEQQLLINDNILLNENQLIEALKDALIWFEEQEEINDFTLLEKKLSQSGFSAGLGNTTERIKETIHLMLELFQSPNSFILEQFISRIPMVSKIAIISPHGWFGQENVMGRPDTGGQVIYILDQVKALEKQLLAELKDSGLPLIQPKILIITRLIPHSDGTTCNQRLEKVQDSENCWILRVPFKDQQGQIVNHWISRFKIWPYLEQFTLDAKNELISEFGGKPDLIVGNYSDGNLVASLLTQQLKVIQCNIAHALEKTKYLFSALYWKKLENDYNFSIQFTADLIAMNRANFIVTSTLQEIIGTKKSIGQYESYQFFTLPGLYKVTSGINLFHPKFNIIPPGIDTNIYFSHTLHKKRVQNQTEHLRNMLLFDEANDIHGSLDNPEKTILFAMSRLDKVKNITGLVEAFGKNTDLQEKANLVLIAGSVHEHESNDTEESNQIRQMYELINDYHLAGKIRWLGKYLSKHATGEIYRIIADRKGVFVQPALFEAFGLTILEGMASGLPVFVTQFGGPLEIIENKKCGFLINPSEPEEISDPILQFILDCEQSATLWDEISKAAVARIHDHFNWDLYAKRMLNLTKMYGFWKYSSSIRGKLKMENYCDLLFHLLYKERAEKIR